MDQATPRRDIINRPTRPDDDGSPVPAGYKGPTYEYATTTACTMSTPGSPGADTQCTFAVTACVDPSRGAGPLTRIWRRTLEVGKPPSTWTLIGVTCYADAVPGSRPRLTMSKIVAAFHTTPWAEPGISTQPVGGVTLVGLPVYYEVQWGLKGFQPGEIDPVILLGYRVDIRPRLDHFTYVFGDGDTFGPTTELGGVYPTGTITHPYLTPGTYRAHVVTTFTADFRVNGGAWAPIPDTADATGPDTTVTVRAARNHLVAS